MLNCFKASILGLLPIFLFISCKPANNQSSAIEVAASTNLVQSHLPQGEFGHQLILAILGDPKTFNDIIAEDLSSRQFTGLMFEGLTTLNAATDEVEPNLAERWEIGADQQTFTFHLRTNVFWNDGQKFTADDVVFTFNDLIYNTNIATQLRLFFSVNGKPFTVEKVDDYTVRFKTPGIYAPFIQFMSQAILPKHKLENAVNNGTFEETWNINTPPKDLVGTGPFRLKNYQFGQRAIFERNPYYWKAAPDGKRLPYLDNVIYELARDQNALFVKFVSGQSDLYSGLRPEDISLAKRFTKTRDFRIVERGPADGTLFFWFNQNPGKNPETGKPFLPVYKRQWFEKTAFRQAVSYVIDRQGIIDGIFMGMGTPLWSMESAANRRWFNPAVKQYPRDLKQARQLLLEAGFRYNPHGLLEDAKGNLVEFTLMTNVENAIRKDLASIIRENLREIGITVHLQFMDFNAMISKVADTFDYEACLLGLGGGANDPSSGLAVLQSSGRLHQWFPSQKTPATAWEARIDELMQLQLQTLDFAKRKTYYDEVQAIMAEQQPFIFLVTPLAFSGIKNRWRNLQMPLNPGASLMWNLEEIWAAYR
jgi:peptide/nickel transport system substrate-binding protein